MMTKERIKEILREDNATPHEKGVMGRLAFERLKLEPSLAATHVYHPDEWNCTYEIGDLDKLMDGADGDGPHKVATLAKLPDQWAVKTEGEWKLYATREAALSSLPKVPHE